MDSLRVFVGTFKQSKSPEVMRVHVRYCPPNANILFKLDHFFPNEYSIIYIKCNIEVLFQLFQSPVSKCSQLHVIQCFLQILRFYDVPTCGVDTLNTEQSTEQIKWCAVKIYKAQNIVKIEFNLHMLLNCLLLRLLLYQLSAT